MKAPADCKDCPCGDDMDNCGHIEWNMDANIVAKPGYSCPYARLERAHNLIRHLRNEIKARDEVNK